MALISQANLTKFFSEHLKLDIELLTQLLDRSEDEVCLLLHHLMKDLAASALAIKPTKNVQQWDWSVQANRDIWERQMVEQHIKPLLFGAGEKLKQSMTATFELPSAHAQQILRYIYECDDALPEILGGKLPWSSQAIMTPEGNLIISLLQHAPLWRVPRQLSIDDIRRRLEHHVSIAGCPPAHFDLLREFLLNVCLSFVFQSNSAVTS